MIRISELGFAYDTTPVLRGITLAVKTGTLCGLFGPNGSGKSTLLKCCLGLLRGQTGQIILDGSDVVGLSPSALARIAAYVPQESQPSFPFSVKELVLMGRTPHLGGRVFSISRRHTSAVAEALDRLGILELAEARFDCLSGGQRQLVLIARAIAQETRILILDEPTSALDLDNQVRIWRNLRELADMGITVLACSHDLNHLSWFCDQVVIMGAGQVIAQGPPETTVTESVLAEVFREPCSVVPAGRSRVVVPRSITGQPIKNPVFISPVTTDGIEGTVERPTGTE